MLQEKKIKLIVFGDTNVGKTCLIHKYLNDDDNEDGQTIGVTFMPNKKIINSQQYNFQIWDTAGQEKYKSITSSFFQNADGGIVVFDVTNQSSFDNIQNWISEFNNKNSKSAKLILVGNKIDLISDRQVPHEIAQNFANNNQISYIEASALTGENVNDVFETLENLAVQNLHEVDIESIDINKNDESKNDENKNDKNINNENKSKCQC